MTQTKYTQIPPAEMSTVTVVRTAVHDTPLKLHYEYAYTVGVRPVNNGFLELFAGLIVRHGKTRAKKYAAMMGVGESQLGMALQAFSGAGNREWTDAFVLPCPLPCSAKRTGKSHALRMRRGSVRSALSADGSGKRTTARRATGD